MAEHFPYSHISPVIYIICYIRREQVVGSGERFLGLLPAIRPPWNRTRGRSDHANPPKKDYLSSGWVHIHAWCSGPAFPTAPWRSGFLIGCPRPLPNLRQRTIVENGPTQAASQTLNQYIDIRKYKNLSFLLPGHPSHQLIMTNVFKADRPHHCPSALVPTR